MIAAVLYALGACLFIAGIGLGVGVIAHEIREAMIDRDAPDYTFHLESEHEKETV